MPSSPYCRLLEHAGFTLSNVRQLVSELGLEGALGRLYDAGVYVTMDEFKGRQPVRREGLEFEVRATDFDNPFLQPFFEAQTSGSRRGPARIEIDVDTMIAESVYIPWLIGVGDYPGRPVASWSAGISTLRFLLVKVGRPLAKDFVTIRFRWTAESVRRAIFTYATIGAGRLFGKRLVKPEYTPRDDALRVARWLAQQSASGTPAVLNANPSLAVRLCLAAKEHGQRLDGTTLSLSGEPYTRAKAAIVEASGARGSVVYGMSEIRVVGIPCQKPQEFDDVHLVTDKLAVLQRPHLTSSGETVPGLVFTNTFTSSPKLMINVESGDYATLTERDCGCLLGEMGLRLHVSGIRSYEKLTSESVTFMGSELLRLLEETLPSRFGGSALDYQLVEEEGEAGLSRVSIIVGPSVGAVDEAAVIETVLDMLQKYPTGGGAVMSEEWRQANTLRVVRREPYATRTAKIQPLHVLSRPEPTDSKPGTSAS